MVFDSSKANHITNYIVFNNSNTAEAFSHYMMYDNLLQFSFSEYDLTHLNNLSLEKIDNDLSVFVYCTRMKHFQLAIKNIDDLKIDNRQIKINTVIDALNLIEKEIIESCEHYFREKLMPLPESTHRIIRYEVLPKATQEFNFLEEFNMVAPNFLDNIDSMRDEVEQYNDDLEYEAVKEIIGENQGEIGVQMTMTSVRPKR